MSEWKESKLSDVATIIMGQSPLGETCNVIGESLPLLNGPTEFGVKSPIPIQFTTDPKKTCKIGDVLFCVRGSTTGRMNWADQVYAIGRGIAAIRHKEGSEYQHFIKGLLDHHLPNMLLSATGSTFPNVSGPDLNNLEIDLPPLPEQKSIASILSNLDDKIDLLHRQNKTLEALAETLFRQWFVEEAEERWKTGKLRDYGEFKNGINYSRDESGNTTYGIINVRDVVGNKFIFKEAVDEINIDFRKAEPYLLQKFDIVIVRSASPGETALILENQKKLIYSGFTIRFRPHKESEAFFFFQLMQSMKMQLDIFSDGTTLKNLNQEILKNVEFQVPSFESIRTFNEKVEPIFDKISKNITQTRTLTRLRDTLLPRLMSGDVRVIN